MKTAVLTLSLLAASLSSAQAAEIRGQINLEHRQFFSSGAQGQDNEQTSLAAEPEMYWQWQQGQSSLTFTPFARVDSLDDERTHADIRELMYLYLTGDYEIRAGIGKVFWGVTESQHLVDVINQTDTLESLDGEDKLGQPMVHLTAVKDWGILEGFVLPYFREASFPGQDGRLRAPILISDDATYESSDEEQHVDYAARYTQSLGDWDIGLSYFNGTNRTADLRFNGTTLTPYYAQMSQFGLDVQGIMGDWLLKLEAINRDSLENHTALTTGFEYTYIGAFDTDWDIGVISEYLYDSRDEKAPTPSQNDLFLGARFVVNDAEGTEVLVGMTQDLDDSDSVSGKVEASSRINNSWKWRLDAWMFSSKQPSDPIYAYKEDDFVELSLEYYF